MAVKTKEQLKTDFSDNTVATGAKFTDLIDSLKPVQVAVSDPSASGYSTQFISSISQDENGEIVVTKKNVSFAGYQTVAGMSAYQTVAGMSDYQTVEGMGIYQENDLQQVGDVTAVPGGTQDILHKMKHFPTVRLMDLNGVEIERSLFHVIHLDNETVRIDIDASLTDRYKYILD